MTIIQKRAGHRVEFQFGEESLKYSVKDPSGSTSFSLPYEEVPDEYSELEERRVWFRNVGYIWIIIGLCDVGYRYTESSKWVLPFWLLLGLACLGYYYLSSTHFIVYNTARGRMFVIVDKKKDQVLKELGTRRSALLKKRFARVIDPSNPDRESARFEWLKQNGVISEDEYDNLMVDLRLGIADAGHSEEQEA